MPVLNPEPRFFREAIESVRAQTMPEWELIIVEDVSARTGEQIVESFRDPRIRYHLSTVRTSLGQQRNRTLKLARAEYVALLDADDVARPDRLEKQIAFLDEHPEVGVVGTWIEAIDREGQTIGYRRYPTGNESICRAMRSYSPLAHPSVMARRNLLLDAGGYPLDRPVAEDYELWSKLAKAGVRFENMPQLLLRYRIHPLCSKSSRLHELIRNTREVKRRYWKTELGLVGQARMALEGLLLLLPASLVLKLFTWRMYEKR